MSSTPSSRHFGLPLVEVGGRVTPALRLLDPAADPGETLDHTLIAGETLDLLAQRYYGREDLWWRIADANPPRFPGDWKPGEVLRIPPLTGPRTGRR